MTTGANAVPKPTTEASAPAILLRPDGQASGLVGGGAGGGLPRPLAPLQARARRSWPRRWISAARSSACPRTTGSASSRAPIPAPSRWRSGRCWAPAASMCWPGRPSARAGSADIAQQLKLADLRKLEAPYGRAARSRRRRFQPRRRLRLERHHLGRARARTAIGSRRPMTGWSSAMRPRRSSPWSCPGRSSMSSPGPGRRCWAAKAPMA